MKKVALQLNWILVLGLLSLSSIAREYIVYEASEKQIDVVTDEGIYTFTPYSESIVGVLFNRSGAPQIFSFSIVKPPAGVIVKTSEVKLTSKSVLTKIVDSEQSLVFDFGELRIDITKSPFTIKYYRKNDLLFEEDTFYIHNTHRGFRLRIQGSEKFYGGGMRVAGMNRRGKVFPLYNRASYGYKGTTEQMHYSIPAVTSNKLYTVYYDNVADGELDIAYSDNDIVEFSSKGGRSAYVVIAGTSYLDLTQKLTDLVGRQPMPPVWAFGNFASRFGYRSQEQVEATVDLFRTKKVPLDATVIDLYWFGKESTGHMGNLDWDLESFPQPTEMIKKLQQQQVKTVLVTEPFILRSSKNWDDAVNKKALMTNLSGTNPKQFDFYFGNTGLVDIFSDDAAEWFWQKVKPRMLEGVAGIWGNLGEPEVHPDDGLHIYGTAEELHNAYGHMWARAFYTRMQRDFPEVRPFLLMRSGFLGSQRFGIIPWSGDVDRSWGGLQQQVEIALQMSLYGLSYIHSDLGGFAGGGKFDKELYIRWLQYGAFTPIFRPHAQDHIASEPVYHGNSVLKAVLPYIELRYKLLPYNYTIARRNSVTGEPMMQPLISFTKNKKDFDNKDSYMWGRAFLVHPIVQSQQKKAQVVLPSGYWYEFFTDKIHEGSRTLNYKVTSELPLFVKAGSIVPMAQPMQSTTEFNREELQFHIYKDPAGGASVGEYYEDDGYNPKAEAEGHYLLAAIREELVRGTYKISLNATGNGYLSMPQTRKVELIVHDFNFNKVEKILARGTRMLSTSSIKRYKRAASVYFIDKKKQKIYIKFIWDYKVVDIEIVPIK